MLVDLVMFFYENKINEMKKMKNENVVDVLIHPDKSKFIPAKIVEYFGFIIDSEKIITYLSDQKQKIYEKCCIIPTKPKLTIRKFASFMGTLTSSFPGNQFAPLYYRAMLKLKDKSLKYNKGNFNAVIKLSEDALHEITLWKKNIFKAFIALTKWEHHI